MSFTDPNNVTSPKNRWRLCSVLYNSPDGYWSVAEGQWKNDGKWEDVLAIRWNGDKNSKIGQPQSHGRPIWFIVPDELSGVLREVVALLPKTVKNPV